MNAYQVIVAHTFGPFGYEMNTTNKLLHRRMSNAQLSRCRDTWLDQSCELATDLTD